MSSEKPDREELQAIAEVVREEAFRRRAAANPQSFARKEFSTPSTVDSSRKIAIHLYEPPNFEETRKGPVVINFHGSGFVLPSLGTNAAWCTRTARRLGIRIVDGDYAKAPERPYPACWQDVADVIRWTLQQPWCSGKVMLTGWSAGGSLTIGFCAPEVAKKHGLSDEQVAAIQGGAAFYPPAGGKNDERLKGPNVKDEKWLKENGAPGIGFVKSTLDWFNACYLCETDPVAAQTMPEVVNLSVSSPATFFTKPLTIVACEYDTLHDEAQELARRLQDGGHGDVAFYSLKGASHNWEQHITWDESKWTSETKGGAGTKEAFDLVEERIKKALSL